MKFICTKDNLLRGLSHVTPIAGRNRQLPILNHVLCQVKEGILHLTCTDLEIGIHTMVAGKVEGEGGFTIPAKKFFEYIQQLPSNNPLYLTTKDNRLHITTEGFTAYFPTGEVEEFPLLPTSSTSEAISLPAKQLCDGIYHVAFAAAKEETRPEIHSLFMHGSGSEVRLAGTDSFRLSEEIIRLEEDLNDFSFLLPLATAHEIVRLFSEEEIVTITPDQNYITFESEGLQLSSRLVEGNYPDYRHIIPTSYKLEGTVETSALIRALKTVAVFLPRDSRRIHMHCSPIDNTVRVRAPGSETGEGEVTIPFQGEGATLEALFNVQYILEGLQHVQSEHCQVQCSGATEPTIIRSLESNRHFLYVVMPIQV